jgi:hypothetical protein
MSVDLSSEITAIATAVLSVFAIVTAWYARRAFLKQSQEVRAIERQVTDQEELTRQQAGVLELQAVELRASLKERYRDDAERHRSQAAMVTAWFSSHETQGAGWGACIRNASDLPVLDVRTFFHYVAEKWAGGDWEPQIRGGPIQKIRVIPPQADRFVAIPEQLRNMIDQVDDSIYVVSIEFTDAAGNRWERDPRGALVPRS